MRTHFFLLMMWVVACAQQISGQSFPERLAAAAMERTRHTVVYDGRYYRIP